MLNAVRLIVLLVYVNNSIQDEEKNKLLRGMKESTRIKRFLIYPPPDPALQEVCNNLPGTANAICKEAGRCHGFTTKMKICGWKDSEPMVCCNKSNRNREETFASRYSNLECGVEYGIPRPVLRRISRRTAENLMPPKIQTDVYAVVGGTEVKPLSFPWMGALDKATYGSNHRFLCGSSLISPRHLLTAAHCFQKEDDKTPEKFSVRLGAYDLSSGMRFKIQAITIHPGYNFKENYNDIAVLTLEDEVPTGEQILPVCLPEADVGRPENLTGKIAIVTGWGHTSYGGVNSPVLREATVPIVDTAQCNLAFMSVGHKNIQRGITDDFLCAGLQEGGKDSCQGDSGGPLQINDGSRFVQVGIVSFGYLCGERGFPGVYIRVAAYVPWINEVIEKTL